MSIARICVPVVLLLCVAAKDEAVSVERSPLTVKTRTFSRSNPPVEMPTLQGNEAAITHSSFGCGALVEASVTDSSSNGGKHSATVEVKSVKVSLTLEITMWLPKNVSEKIRAHEEGHRQIDEHFYKTADEKVAVLAKNIVGKTYTADGSTKSEAADNAIKRAADEINGQYMSAVQKKASSAQKIYDEVTDHGRNRVQEKDAMERAIKRAATEEKN